MGAFVLPRPAAVAVLVGVSGGRSARALRKLSFFFLFLTLPRAPPEAASGGSAGGSETGGVAEPAPTPADAVRHEPPSGAG